jgi:hypothetical protein
MTAGVKMIPVTSRVGRQRSRLPLWYRRREVTILSFSGLIAFVLIWEFASLVYGSDFLFFFSSPSHIATAAIKEIQLPRFYDDQRLGACGR